MSPKHFAERTRGNLTGEAVDVHLLTLMVRTGHLSRRCRRRDVAAEGDRTNTRSSNTRMHISFPFSPPCRLFSPCDATVVDFLFVDVDDVLHQQVPLQAVDTVAIQHHLVSAGRATETTAVHHHGGACLEQGGLNRKKSYKNVLIIILNNDCFALQHLFNHLWLHVNTQQLGFVVTQHCCMLGFQ